jgi:hypothetical protein
MEGAPTGEQADSTGRYDNSGFRLRGHQYTASDGSYRLATVVPALYKALLLTGYRDQDGGKAASERGPPGRGRDRVDTARRLIVV